jgi:hypothetical protein
MRVAGSARTDGSARISHSEFAIDKQRIVGSAQGWSKRSPGLVTGSDHDQAHAALSQSSRKLESEAELEALVCPA